MPQNCGTVYLNMDYGMYPKNSSASGKKKDGGHHVVKAFCLMNIMFLLCSLFF